MDMTKTATRTAPAGTVIATITPQPVTDEDVLAAVKAAGYPCAGIERGDNGHPEVQFYVWNDDDIRARIKLMDLAKWAGREFRPVAPGVYAI